MKKNKIIVVIFVLILVLIFSRKNIEANTTFSCDARMDSSAVNVTLEITDGDPDDYKIGVLETNKDDYKEANFNAVSDVSENKLITTYNLSVLNKGVNYKVLVFAKEAGTYIVELPGCNFTTPLLVNGDCGTAVGKTFQSKPTENLCASGQTQGVSQTPTEWRWVCYGINGGNNSDICKAKVGSSAGEENTTKDKNDTVDASSSGSLLVPECPPEGCGFDQFMQLIKKVINFLLFVIATPLAALVFVYAGIMLLTSAGDPGKLKTAKTILINLLIGYGIALAAWLIINTILSSLGYTGTWFLTR